MKKIMYIFAAAALLLGGCTHRRERYTYTEPDETEETTVSYFIGTEPYRAIVSPDFRVMLWGMSVSEVCSQEQRMPDIYCSSLEKYCELRGTDTPDITVPQGSAEILGFDGIRSFGCDCRLVYCFTDRGCVSAEYVIPQEEQKYGAGTIERTDIMLGDFYGEAVEGAPEGVILRKTRTADISLSAAENGDVHVLFEMPEGYLDVPPQTSKLIIFEDDHTIVITD